MMESNSSVFVHPQGELERIMVTLFTSLSCIVLLTINAIILYTLRSKPVFREKSRYIFLTNMLIADTIFMMVGQTLYVLVNSSILLSYPVCGLLVLYAMLTDNIFPLTLALMSLERYVSVCFPLRHATIVTMRSTAVAILLVWTFSFVNILIRIVLMCQFPFEELKNLYMTVGCNPYNLILTPVAVEYDRVYNIFLFVMTGFIVVYSFIAVLIAARSASTDRKSVRKVQNTLLLHMIQLILGLSSTILIPVFFLVFQFMSRISFIRMINVMCFLIFILPRGFSPLIYGLRDQNIRPILLYNLCCGLKPAVKIKISH